LKQLIRNYTPATVVLLPVVGRLVFSLSSHATKLGLLLVSSASCSAADAFSDSTPPNEALLPLDIPLVEAVPALERQSFWLFCLPPFGGADIFFLSLLVGRRYYETYFWQYIHYSLVPPALIQYPVKGGAEGS
jgi:hypothetical protein